MQKLKVIKRHTTIKVPKTAKVVVQPELKQAIEQSASRRQAIIAKPRIPITRSPVIARVSQPTNKVRGPKRKPPVTYKTRDIGPESIEKIKKLKNVGVGKKLLIIGNGPSILDIDLHQLKNKIDAISINKPDERIWPTTYWAFFDSSQIRRHRQLWDTYDSGYIFNSTSIRTQKHNSIQFKNMGGHGFSLNALKGIHIGMSSVYASMQISLWLNYDIIYIIGCDMNPEGMYGRLHFYGTNPDVKPDIRIKRFKAEAEYYNNAAEKLDSSIRDRFVFCSKGINPWPFMDKFRSIKHTEVIEEIL